MDDDFKQVFERTWWGWRMRGFTDANSPVTLWQCAGMLYQVSRWRWTHGTYRSLADAMKVATALAVAGEGV